MAKSKKVKSNKEIANTVITNLKSSGVELSMSKEDNTEIVVTSKRELTETESNAIVTYKKEILDEISSKITTSDTGTYPKRVFRTASIDSDSGIVKLQSEIGSQGVATINGGTGEVEVVNSVCGQTGDVYVVCSWNGLTGVVDVTSSTVHFGGISIDGGATFGDDIKVNDLTIGKGGGDLFSNTAVGYQALNSNTEGESNVAFGWRALYYNTEGDNNIASGMQTLFSNTSGDNNSAYGYQALYSNTEGDNNSALGYYAGFNGTTGSNNTYIGHNAQPSSATASNEIVLGDSNVTLIHSAAGMSMGGGATFGGAVNLVDNELSRPKLKDYSETALATTTKSASFTVDFEDGNVQSFTIDEDATIDFENWPASGVAGTVTLIITGGDNDQTITWDTPVKWPGDNAPALSDDGVDIVSFMTIDAGTTIYGFVGGINFS